MNGGPSICSYTYDPSTYSLPAADNEDTVASGHRD